MPSLSGLMEEDDHSLEAQFAAAVKVIRSLPGEGPFQPSDDMMLMFYSYYMQASMGPCNIPRPLGFWDSRGKAKWDAWSSLGNMTKEDAMKNYIERIQLILETIPISEEVSELVQKLGNFYTEVDTEEEANESDKRPFTRPFAAHAEELLKSIKKPKLEGYGDLWEDIQNLQQTDSSVCGLSVSSEEAERSKDSSEVQREEEGCVWRRCEEEDWDDSINTVDGNKEDEKDWSPDPRFLMVDDKRWRSDTKGSSSSGEPNMSFTNCTHSSLNSELEEEELACSIEPSVQFNPYMHINGHLSDPSDAAPERYYRPADSDNEEFCDSMEHLAMEEQLSASKGFSPVSGTTSERLSGLRVQSNKTPKVVEDEVFMGDFYLTEGVGPRKYDISLSRRGRGSHSPKITSNPLQCISIDAACGCVLKSRRPFGVKRGNINEQIATALLRLQHDMADVLHRLHALEELARSQSRSSSPRQEQLLPVAQKLLRPSWWPFDYSPLTVVLSALWPLVSHWLVQLYLQRKRRKIP